MNSNKNSYNISQINIAILKFPIDDSRGKEFVNNLDRINSIALKNSGIPGRFLYL